MKNGVTFVYPNSASGRYRSNNSGFFVPFSFILILCLSTVSSFRNCLNTISPCRVWITKMYDAVLFLFRLTNHVLVNNIQIKQMLTNQTIALSSMSEDANLPTALQEAINEFFCYNGTPADIDEKLFSMLESATAGVEEVGLDAKDVSSYLFFYKTAKILFNQLHSFTAKTNVELCEN